MDIKFHNSNRLRVFLPICFENILLSFSKSINEEYIKAFVDYWNFSYVAIDNDYKIGEKIEVIHNLSKNLEENCCIKIETINNFTIKELIYDIQNTPTIIHTDTFYLDWNSTFYHKKHTEHVSLAIDYNESLQSISIADTDFPNNIFKIKVDLLKEACRFYYKITKVNGEEKKINELLVENIIHNKNLYLNMFDSIKKFSIDFMVSFNYLKEFVYPYGPDEVLESKLIENIRLIIKGRFLFMDYLLSNHYENISFDYFIELLYVSASKWDHIINILIKHSIIGWKSNINIKISNVIKEILEIEEKAYNYLYNILTVDINEIKLIKPYDHTFYVIISLYSYYNNKGIISFDMYKSKNSYPTSLADTGEYLVIDDKYLNGNIEINEFLYKIDYNKDVDNIVCDGQIIKIDSTIECLGVGILCCTEFGINHEHITVLDSTLYSEEIFFDSYDIADLDAKDTIKIGSSYIISSQEKVRDVNVLTSNICYFSKPIKIASLKLPYCSNLHIFSITLIR